MLGIAAIGERAGDIAEIEGRGRAVGPDELNALQRIERCPLRRCPPALPVIRPPLVAWRLADIGGMDELRRAVGAAVIGRIVDQACALNQVRWLDEDRIGAVGIGDR